MKRTTSAGLRLHLTMGPKGEKRKELEAANQQLVRYADDLNKTISELKSAYEKLRETRDMLVQTEKLAAVGRLTAGIAHEILNPVNVISMRLQMLGLTEEFSDRGRNGLNICKDQLNRIVGITKDLGQFSRIHEKQVTMNDLNKLIGHVMTLCAPQFKVEGIKTDVQYHPHLPLIPLAEDRIEQVIFNIVSNAAGVMTGQKTKILRIITRPEPSGDYVDVIISDTGTGIDASNMNKIFDPFFTTKDPDQGTGLGLFITYGIIKDHGARIWAENNEWGGASFFIKFPVEPHGQARGAT